MIKTGRNDPCPCGSGKKFKKCHMGREDELVLDSMGEITDEMSLWITGLPEVNYGRSREIADGLNIKELTGNSIGVRFVDLKSYSDLNLFGGAHSRANKGESGGIFINIIKTLKTDPDNIYLAISSDIDDSTLAHELAHVLDYLDGSKLMPGTLDPLSFETGVNVDHLEHPEEFGKRLDHISEKFNVHLDADDTIISFLYKNRMLIKGKDIEAGNVMILKTKSDRILTFLSENTNKIDALIKDRSGYIGSREVVEESKD